MEDWAEIVAEHGNAVWQAAYRLLGSEADAADCVQETFAAAVEVSRREAVRNWPGLLRRLGTMRALGMLRRRLRQRKHLDAAEMLEIPDPAPGPAERAEALEAAQALRKALAALPEREAVAFSLRFLEDLSYEQIAEALDLSGNAAGVLIHRAKTKLRRLMTVSEALGKDQVHHD
jgi:RNA polymerase sigma-70 factor, ECF subfamily